MASYLKISVKFKGCFFFQAKRENVNCLILPEENKKDYNELPKFITDGLEVHFVAYYKDIFKLVFKNQ